MSNINMSNSLFVTKVISSFYNDIFSISWTPERYNSFLNFSVLVISVAQNNHSSIVIIHSLKLVERYMKLFDQEAQLKYSERSIFIIAFKISQKFLDDFYNRSRDIDLSLLTELDKSQLKKFEWEFMKRIRFDINMTPTEHILWASNCHNIYNNFMGLPVAKNHCSSSIPNKNMLIKNHGLASPPFDDISKSSWLHFCDEYVCFD